MTRRRHLEPWERELAHRAASPDRIAARAARGRALCDAVLAGGPLPQAPDPAPEPDQRGELTSCPVCFAPVDAGAPCIRCPTPTT